MTATITEYQLDRTETLHFDHEHGQRGAAPNQIEIHPVISLVEAKE